jgi:sulfatase maturation enzyme AslB (radical SAM superfamily)
MGGETLITSRFEQFVDFMTQHKKFDLHFSFVTNGTTFNLDLINKLKKFRRVGIEVSIETVTEHNSYQRQGTDTDVVLKNIHRYLEHCNSENITLTARPAISALTIGNYWTLLQYCLEQKIMVKSLLVTDPAYLSAEVLPTEVKQLYAARYQEFVQHSGLESMDLDQDYNESDPNQLGRIIKQQALQCINLLEQPQPHNSDQLLTEMVSWCSQWDQVHGYNARTLYPELKDVLDQYGY